MWNGAWAGYNPPPGHRSIPNDYNRSMANDFGVRYTSTINTRYLRSASAYPPPRTPRQQSPPHSQVPGPGSTRPATGTASSVKSKSSQSPSSLPPSTVTTRSACKSSNKITKRDTHRQRERDVGKWRGASSSRTRCPECSRPGVVTSPGGVAIPRRGQWVVPGNCLASTATPTRWS